MLEFDLSLPEASKFELIIGELEIQKENELNFISNNSVSRQLLVSKALEAHHTIIRYLTIMRAKSPENNDLDQVISLMELQSNLLNSVNNVDSDCTNSEIQLLGENFKNTMNAFKLVAESILENMKIDEQK